MTMFKITFPKLRIPTWTEFWGMFSAATHVGQIVTGIERQVARLDAVIAHQLSHAEKHDKAAAGFRAQALDATEATAQALAEAARASRVSANLATLVA